MTRSSAEELIALRQEISIANTQRLDPLLGPQGGSQTQNPTTAAANSRTAVAVAMLSATEMLPPLSKNFSSPT